MPLRETKEWMPFNIYDFFGYIFPGISIAVLLLAFFIPESITTSRYFKFILSVHKNANVIAVISEIVICIVAVYCLGQIIAAFSHVFIDRIIIGTIFGYPYLSFLKLKVKKRDFASPIHKLIFLVSNLLIAGAIFAYWHKNYWPLINIALVVLLFLIALRFISKIIRTLFRKIDDIIVSEHRYFRKPYLCSLGFIDKTIDAFFVEPLKKLLNIDHLFDTDYAIKLKSMIDTKFGPEIKNTSDNFWLPCLYVIQREPFARKIDNWLQLYSLNRNLSLAFFIASIVFVTFLSFHPNLFSERRVWLLIISVFGSWAFGIRYLMLYYTYYSKNVFRSFHVMETPITFEPRR